MGKISFNLKTEHINLTNTTIIAVDIHNNIVIYDNTLVHGRFGYYLNTDSYTDRAWCFSIRNMSCDEYVVFVIFFVSLFFFSKLNLEKHMEITTNTTFQH